MDLVVDEIVCLREASFHVIIFSLLLSYLPTPLMRLQACERARRALMETGILIIMTPDSNHQGKAVARMKAWKAAIESVGFKRWKYSKVRG